MAPPSPTKTLTMRPTVDPTFGSSGTGRHLGKSSFLITSVSSSLRRACRGRLKTHEPQPRPLPPPGERFAWVAQERRLNARATSNAPDARRRLSSPRYAPPRRPHPGRPSCRPWRRPSLPFGESAGCDHAASTGRSTLRPLRTHKHPGVHRELRDSCGPDCHLNVLSCIGTCYLRQPTQHHVLRGLVRHDLPPSRRLRCSRDGAVCTTRPRRGMVAVGPFQILMMRRVTAGPDRSDEVLTGARGRAASLLVVFPAPGMTVVG